MKAAQNPSNERNTMQCNCGARTVADGENGPVCKNGHDVVVYNAEHEDIRSDYAKRTGTTVSMEPIPPLNA